MNSPNSARPFVASVSRVEQRNRVKILQSLVALSCAWTSALADISEVSPEMLCRLLEPFGIVNTAFESPGEAERPLCYTVSQPTSVPTDSYEFSYRVLAHWEHSYLNSLFLQVEGTASKILGQAPHARFVEMSDRILSELFTDATKAEIVLALQSLSPGDNRHMVVEGISVQVTYEDYAAISAQDAYARLRLDVQNVCNYSPDDVEGRGGCIAENFAPRGSMRDSPKSR